MSYILEALKKLEEKRRKPGPPLELSAPSPGTTARAERRQPWPYLLVAGLLLNAGLLLWWLLPGEHSGTLRLDDKRIEQPASFSDDAGTSPQKRAFQRRDITIRPSPDDGMKGHSGAPALSSGGAGPKPAPAAKQSPSEASPTRAAGNREERKIYAISDLPSPVRQGLPDIAISGHFYSAEPSSRIVVINGKTLHEGQTVTGDLRLEQVISDGVIMSYQGYRFRKEVF